MEPSQQMSTRHAPPAAGRRVISVRRGLSSAAFGIAAGGVAALTGAPELTPLLSWTVAVVVLLTRVWRVCWRSDPDDTKELAEAEGRSRSTDAWVLAAAVASLGAVVDALVRSSGNRDATAVALVVLGVLTVILSWALVNTVFAFRYARLYYRGEPDGGINFKQDQPPAYSDFAYMAFTVGMTYGVTETEPTSTIVRRTALGHALLSYLFGTGVLAVAVNLVTNLAG
jgi:uncharacterized membrane protein